MDGLGGLRVKTIPFEMVYQESERDIETIADKYGQALYGMLILGSVFKSSPRASRKFIRKFVFSSFYSWHMYSRKWKYSKQLISKDNYLAWNQDIAEALIWESSQIVYVFYQLFKVIPFRTIRKLQRTFMKYLSKD
jgi:hypothetical protein